MSLATYADLQTAVQTWLSRTGDTKITGNIADIVTLCENMIAYGNEDPQFPVKPLRYRGMEVSAELVISTPVTVSMVGGTANAITLTPTTAITSYANGLLYQFTATASNTGATTIAVSGLAAISVVKSSARIALAANDILNGGTYNIYYDAINAQFILMPQLAHVPLPANYLAIRSWYYIWQNNFLRPITYSTPTQVNDMRLVTTSGPPERYTIEADAIRFAPSPDSTYFAPMLYYQKLPGLVANSTNRLMTDAPNIYLFGCLMWARILLQDDAGAARYMRLYVAAQNSLQTQDEFDRHSGSVMAIQNLTGNP